MPIDPGVVLPFLLAVSFVELTPGPNMAYLAALSATQGRAAGFKAVLGITAGLAVYLIAAVIGVAEVIATMPVVYALLRWSGVVFLLYLAWQAWRGEAEASPGTAQGSADGALFWRGFTVNVLNPKAAIFYVSLLSGFIAAGHAVFWVQATILGCIHLLVSIAVHSAIVIGAARAGALIERTQQMNAVRRTLAVCIALIAVWLAWETRAL